MIKQQCILHTWFLSFALSWPATMLMLGSSRSSRTRSWLGRVMGQSWTPRRSKIDSFCEDCCFRRQVRSSIPLWRLEGSSYVIICHPNFILRCCLQHLFVYFCEDCCFRRQIRSSVLLWRLEGSSYVIICHQSYFALLPPTLACVLVLCSTVFVFCLISSWRILTPVFVTTCGLSKRQVFARTASLSINVERVEIVASDANSAVQPRSDDYCLDRSLIFLYMSQTAEQCLEPPCFPLSHQYEFYNS